MNVVVVTSETKFEYNATRAEHMCTRMATCRRFPPKADNTHFDFIKLASVHQLEILHLWALENDMVNGLNCIHESIEMEQLTYPATGRKNTRAL